MSSTSLFCIGYRGRKRPVIVRGRSIRLRERINRLWSVTGGVDCIAGSTALPIKRAWQYKILYILVLFATISTCSAWESSVGWGDSLKPSVVAPVAQESISVLAPDSSPIQPVVASSKLSVPAEDDTKEDNGDDSDGSPVMAVISFIISFIVSLYFFYKFFME